jgi:hypothetical protein
MQTIAEEENLIGLWPIRAFGFIQQTFKSTNVDYKGIGALLKLVKFILSLLNFVKIGINIGKLIQDNIIIINIFGN